MIVAFATIKSNFKWVLMAIVAVFNLIHPASIGFL
jgi:hypothetical protein